MIMGNTDCQISNRISKVFINPETEEQRKKKKCKHRISNVTVQVHVRIHSQCAVTLSLYLHSTCHLLLLPLHSTSSSVFSPFDDVVPVPIDQYLRTNCEHGQLSIQMQMGIHRSEFLPNKQITYYTLSG